MKSFFDSPQGRPAFTPDSINSLSSDEVFVFGSNLAGHHAGGAARTAFKKFGAIYGQGVGLQGQSYAIPTMQGGAETIAPYVDEFIDFAKEHPDLFFYVTRIGCGIAGFKDGEIAPLFRKALELSNVCLPESFVHVLDNPQIPESYKIMKYGQVRTLADIVKVLNEEHHYDNLEKLMTDFREVLEQYRRRGTISAETFDLIQSVFQENKRSLFNKRRLNIARLEKILTDKNNINDKMEEVFYKRSIAKMLRIIQYLNNYQKYTAPEQILKDIQKLFNSSPSVFNDSFHYPLYFFEHGLRNLWDKITQNGILDNILLEKVMFGQHDEKVEKLGINKVIRIDYEDDGPCHPEVYFPREVGTGPVYVKGDRTFIKSCGEGKGPNSIPDYYERELLEIIRDSEVGC
jgi:hypothetical protein